jgi:hypothetical protein
LLDWKDWNDSPIGVTVKKGGKAGDGPFSRKSGPRLHCFPLGLMPDTLGFMPKTLGFVPFCLWKSFTS